MASKNNTNNNKQGNKRRQGQQSHGEKLSRALSWALRHQGPKIGLSMTADGYVPVSQILASPHPKLNKGSWTLNDIEEAVKTSDKQRFHLDWRPTCNYPDVSFNHLDIKEDKILCIRASQGHSLDLIDSDLLLTTIPKEELRDIPIIVHGTFLEPWESSICSNGLNRMTRNHIHFATGFPKDGVISGMRKSCTVYIYIDAVKCANHSPDTITFYRSANGVLLTAGIDESGILPVEFFSRVTDSAGKILLDQRQPRNIITTEEQVLAEDINSRKRVARQYGATFVCMTLLERWLELGTRPNETLMAQISLVFSAAEKGETLQDSLIRLGENPVDDLKELKALVNETRRLLWKTAPEPNQDSHLEIGKSKIPKAQLGLFTIKDLPANTVCCYYSGDIHSAKSSQSATMLKDSSYLLRIGTWTRQPWWYQELQADEGSETHGAYSSLSEQWDKLLEECLTTEEFFVDPANLNIKARYINDCREEGRYNVRFVLDPAGERAAVVTLREIRAGEELYVSYGQAYWDSMEATTGIVPRRLPSASEESSL